MATTARQTHADPAAGEDSATLPRLVGRVLSARQFWDLMARWQVPDAVALELIEFPGKLGASGKRPRFRFTTRQQRITSYLAEIDAALDAAQEDASWLHRKIATRPFDRRTPIEHMREQGMSGMSDLLRWLYRAALQRSLRSSSRS